MALSTEFDIPVAALDDAPAVRAVDEIIDAAVSAHASDVYVEPFGDAGRVRQRVDGVLRETRTLAAVLLPRVISRLKLLAGMDIGDRRLPQDGHWTLGRLGRRIDIRVASMPAAGGETLALRVFDTSARVPALDRLGMPQTVLEPYQKLVAAPSGFVVACGPTGSGKTTTLYASMLARNQPGQHLCSIEDPIEVRITGIAQVQVNARAGLSFACALRSLLRQDPDVIMIGEMRDAETATTAIAAALSGQLVLTTLHSADAIGALERLIELGVTPRALAAAGSGILSQRLLRQLCPHCKRRREDSYEACGCDRCGGAGYRGRLAVFELLRFSEELRAALTSAAPSAQLRKLASRNGYVGLQEQAARLAREGETTCEEIRRVIGGERAQ